MSNEIAEVQEKKVDLTQFKNLLDPQVANGLAVIDTMASELASIKEMKLATVEALATAQFKKQVEIVLGQNIELLMDLQNSPIGFKTDRYNGYPQDVVKKCAVVALAYGCHLSGNQFNIIANNAYITKEGYFYKLTQLVKKGVLEYRINHGIAKPTDKFELLWEIESEVTWKVGRKKDQKQKLSFVIKGAGLKKDHNSGQIITDANGKPTSLTTQDQIRGKADRKVMHWLFCTITSSHIPDIPDNLDDGDIIEGKTSEKPNIFDEMEKEESEQKQDVVDAEIVKDQEPQDKSSVPDGTFEFDKISTKDFETSDHYVTWMISRCNYLEINPNEFKEKLIERGLIKQGVIMNSLPVETLFNICKTSEEIFKQILA